MNKVFLIVLKLSVALASECLHRDYGYSSTVCVCNSQHCDTVLPVQKIDPSHYLTFTSNQEGLRFYKSIDLIKEKETENDKEYINNNKNNNGYTKETDNAIDDSEKTSDNNNIITIDQNKTYQRVLGWGGAITDSTGFNLKSLDQKLQDQLWKSYFSKEGLEYNLARVPIGCTDFSLRGYTYLDTEHDNDFQEDPLLTKFRLAEEDYKYKIPFIKKALDLNDQLLLLGATWTAPKWMKENRNYEGTMGYLKKNMYKPWANYLIKFLDAYNSHNISFWGVTTGNEVFYAMALMNVPAMLWIPEELRDWIHFYLGPAIRNSSYSDLKILANDDNRPIIEHSLDTLLSEPANQAYIDGTAIHWYFDNEDNAYMLSEAHEKYPEKILLYTEACNGVSIFNGNKEPVWLGSWERGEAYASNIIEDLNHWVVGWLDWNLALDLNGGPTYTGNFIDSAIIVNATAQEFYKQPMYYNLGHFSKFVPRDSVRIYSSQNSSDVQVVAFKRPDGGVVIIILNKTDNIQSRTILDDIKGQIKLELSSRSITTILYW